jgi:CBS domain-containing protein
MKVANILATKGGSVITVGPGQSVREAVALLVNHGIGSVVVVDETHAPIGIITERHIVRRFTVDDGLADRTVAGIMSTQVITATPQDELASLVYAMTERRIRHVPIVSAGKLVGIVSMGDILKAQRDDYRGEAETLEFRILNP